jgi:hypothetical protein
MFFRLWFLNSRLYTPSILVSAFIVKILFFFRRGAKIWTTKTTGAYCNVLCFNEHSFRKKWGYEMLRIQSHHTFTELILLVISTRANLFWYVYLLCVTPLITGTRNMDSVQFTYFCGTFYVFLTKILNHIPEISIIYDIRILKLHKVQAEFLSHVNREERERRYILTAFG